MTARKAMSPAERTTFAVSLLVLLVVIGLIAVQMLGADRPAAPVAHRDGPVREASGHYFVPVTLRNEGDTTAANVQVTAELTIGEETIEADQTVDFLAGGESEELEFVFAEDPEEGELEVRVTGYQVP